MTRIFLSHRVRGLKNFLKSILGFLIGAIIGFKISISGLDNLYNTLDLQGMELWSLIIIIMGTLVGGVIGYLLVRAVMRPILR